MKQFTKNIYDISPIWFQNIMISLYGYKLIKQRYGKSYYEAFAYYKDKDNSKIEQELEIQNTEFKKLIKYAIKNSEFYRDFYKNIDIENITSIDDLHKLPILEKEMLRSNINNIYTIPKEEAVESFTGGTTGKSLKIYFTKNDFQKRMAYLDVFKYKLGVDTFKTKKATFSGRSFISKSIQYI